MDPSQPERNHSNSPIQPTSASLSHSPPPPPAHPPQAYHHPYYINQQQQQHYSQQYHYPRESVDARNCPPQHRLSQQLGQPRGHDSVISHPFSPKGSSPPSPSSSVSSSGRPRRDRNQRVPTADEIQPIPQTHSRHSRSPVYPQQGHVQDPEKALGYGQSPRSQDHRVSSNPEVTAILYDAGEYNEKGPEDKAVQLLLFLSGPCAFLSLAIVIWTLVCLFVALILQPLRICTKRPDLGTQLTSFLAPPLNLQLRLIYNNSPATGYSTPMLLIVHILSPLLAVGVAVAAWTAAFFWFFSAILGDPAGQDGYNDGKDSILGVRNWWDRWLSKALR